MTGKDKEIITKINQYCEKIHLFVSMIIKVLFWMKKMYLPVHLR